MTKIPLLHGVVAGPNAEFALSYPVNLEPVSTNSGIAQGQLRTAMGARQFSVGPGPMRGAIAWNGRFYAVMGSKLVTMDAAGVVTLLGDVGGSGPVAIDYGFDRLAIQSGLNLYYWNGTTLTQVTNVNLGPCVDAVWMAGYFVSTDGTSIVTTQLSDPTLILPNKYGSAEEDPDMVTGLIRVRGELAVLGQNTVEYFSNVGGSGFPFQVSEGATIPIGCVGPRAKVIFGETFAFCGSGRNHGIGVWLAQAGAARKLSTRAIDDILASVADPTSIVLEARTSRDEARLYVHLPDQTLVFLANASQASEEPVWYIARSGVLMDSAYRPRFAILCYNLWLCGDIQSDEIGVLDETVPGHFGDAVGWQFDTAMLSNNGNGGIVHDLELVGLFGRGDSGSAFLSFTVDGETWTMERANRMPRKGARTKRVTWSPHKRFRNYLGMRFRGDGGQLVGLSALEARIEPLAA